MAPLSIEDLAVNYMEAPSAFKVIATPGVLSSEIVATNDTEPKKMLFVCTGNYYRSRYAEAVFNHLARMLDLRWTAFSRGLNIHTILAGDLSPHVREDLARQGLSLSLTGPRRTALTELDLASANRAVALKESEHRPMMAEQFPAWVDRIEYWHVHDLDRARADDALPQIYDRVKDIAGDLAGNERAP